MSQRAKVIIIHGKDNVATALEPLAAGSSLVVDIGGTAERVTILADIPVGHKVALRPISAGENVVKYGEPIGQASSAIAAGEHVHVHNVMSHGTKAGGG
jgi:altronate dehydratase